MELIGDGKRFAAAELWKRWIQDMVKTVTEYPTQLIAKERKRGQDSFSGFPSGRRAQCGFEILMSPSLERLG